jgi:hypothetical protein
LHRDASKIEWGFSCNKGSIDTSLCQNIYCVCISK